MHISDGDKSSGFQYQNSKWCHFLSNVMRQFSPPSKIHQRVQLILQSTDGNSSGKSTEFSPGSNLCCWEEFNRNFLYLIWKLSTAETKVKKIQGSIHFPWYTAGNFNSVRLQCAAYKPWVKKYFFAVLVIALWREVACKPNSSYSCLSLKGCQTCDCQCIGCNSEKKKERKKAVIF